MVQILDGKVLLKYSSEESSLFGNWNVRLATLRKYNLDFDSQQAYSLITNFFWLQWMGQFVVVAVYNMKICIPKY